MIPPPRRPFLLRKRYPLRRRARTIAQARRTWEPLPACWTIASPVPLAEFREKLAEVHRRAGRPV